ncbi:MAG: hypothetical protein ABIE43_02240 [Patescibacteria group bacterium]
MKLNVDYHFHPNLPKNEKKAIRKCQKWWEIFQKNNINVVIVTEHVYKNPKRAYQLMKETKPANSYLLPGMEYLTKEGIDIIIFSENQNLYGFNQLQPYNLTFNNILNLISNSCLAAYITHPYTIGTTSIIKKLGYEIYKNAIDNLGSVEITNSSFDNLNNLLKKPFLNKLFTNKIKKVEKTKKLPKKEYPKKIKFLAAGSDAHHFKEIGTYVSINNIDDNLFNNLISNKNPDIYYKDNEKIDFHLLFSLAITDLRELLIKQKIKWLQK